ncbi:MAG TPA: hypothetical protein VHA33_02525 [Candidatus Angelobacter sp.]|nr:hypothetical protein [Candidatus Angelobacter sp.]
MDRMEYDPEGGNYLPVTERETGSTLIVVGIVMLIAAGLFGIYVEWDIRAGNVFMRLLFAVDVVVALLLIAVGMHKKNRSRK